MKIFTFFWPADSKIKSHLSPNTHHKQVPLPSALSEGALGEGELEQGGTLMVPRQGLDSEVESPGL